MKREPKDISEDVNEAVALLGEIITLLNVTKETLGSCNAKDALDVVNKAFDLVRVTEREIAPIRVRMMEIADDLNGISPPEMERF